MSNETELTPDTTFYALTADVDGYTLEDQVLGPLTLREWLKAHNGPDAEQSLAEELSENCRLWIDHPPCVNTGLMRECRFEAFTPAELLNRLRLDAMQPIEE